MAFALAVGSFGLTAAAPMLTLRAVPAVSCVRPSETLYEKQINVGGTIEARQTKEIYLETPVIASAVNVSVGDRVEKGQVLAVIDRELTKGVLERSVPAASLLEGLQVTPQDASDLLGLYSALQSSGLAGGSPDALEELAKSVGLAAERAPVEDYLYIPDEVVAPMDGVVTGVDIKSDVLTRTASPLVTISDTASYVAMVQVGESYISDVRVGDGVVLKGTGFSDRAYQGHVSKVYPAARRVSGTAQEAVVDVEIAIDDPDEGLKEGFTVRAEITTGARRNMLTVPYEAVRQDERNVEYVYLAQGSRAVRRNIVTGVELLEGVEVKEGLAAGDLVIADAAKVAGEDALVHLQRSGEDAAG